MQEGCRMGRSQEFIRLSAEDEKAYAIERIQSGLQQIRISFVVFAVLYGLFAILDNLLAVSWLPVFLFIRFGVVIPVFLLFTASTFHPSFVKVAQPFIVVCMVAGTTGIAFMLVVQPGNFSYYGGYFMVILAGYFLLKLDTCHALLGSMLSLALFLLGHWIYHGSLDLNALLVTAFFTGANLIGALGNYQLEQNSRANFLQKQEVLSLNLQLQERVHEQRTELIQIEKAIDSTSDAIIIFNERGEITYHNQAYVSLMQSALPDVPVASHPFADIVGKVIYGGAWKGERFLTDFEGHQRVLLVQADAVRDDAGRIAGVVTTCRDITERKDAEEKMRYLSFHDQLTGLYNRTWFDEELHRLDKARQLPLTIVMADLNGLKLINDTYGHAVGDSFLRYSADILRHACLGADILARWGGDEFVILLPQTSYAKARLVADGIALSFQETQFEGMPVSVALGVASKEEMETDLSTVLQEAEDRMYKQKLTESRSHKSAVLNALRNTLQEKSYETDTHAGNMQESAHYLGGRLGLSRDELSRLDLVIRLHDIGKINMPAELLRKDSALTEEEWELMRQHPEIGYRIARATDEVAHVAKEILSHHERWDGKGYPRGLAGVDIPLLARITTLVDACEVMWNGRPYKIAMTPAEIRTELQRCAGTQFDPELVALLLDKPEYQEKV